MINELSIIIPVLNEERYISLLLRSIVAQQFEGKLEIIIVDGKSTDNTIKVIQKFKSVVHNLHIISTQKGIAHQRNVGAVKAKYPHILFLDADMILPQNFLHKLLHKSYGKQFVAGVLFWTAEFDIITNILLLLLYPFFIFVGYYEHFLPGGLILTTKENHKKIQGFREDLLISEDSDYTKRSCMHGATYHLKVFPFALHSARRVYRMGRLKFVFMLMKIYCVMKKYGVEFVQTKVKYDFGSF